MLYKENKCGTYAGYQRHRKIKEKPCKECTNAARIYSINYYYKNWERVVKRQREYKKNNPKHKASKLRSRHRRRARIRGNRVGYYTVKEVLDMYGIVCYLCSKEIDLEAPRNCTGDNWENGLHIDHVIDIQYGGADSIDNVRPTHAICNINKGLKNKKEAPAQDNS
jgi:hypothetical protein